MTPDEAVIQRCPNDKSSGGARLPASPAPDGHHHGELAAQPARQQRGQRCLDMPRVVGCGLQSGRVVEQACGEPRRPRGAGTGDRYQQEAVRGSRQRDKAAAGQALGRKQHHIQDEPCLRRRERRARRKAGQVQPHRTAPRDKAGREALAGCPGPAPRRPGPRRRAIASAAVPVRPWSAPRVPGCRCWDPPRARSPARQSAHPAARPGHGRAGRRAVQRGAKYRSCRSTSPTHARTTRICRNNSHLIYDPDQMVSRPLVGC